MLCTEENGSVGGGKSIIRHKISILESATRYLPRLRKFPVLIVRVNLLRSKVSVQVSGLFSSMMVCFIQ